MYFSRVRLIPARLTPSMMDKWDSCQPYVSHQWLWQLFPDSEQRDFLFRRETDDVFYLLSHQPPQARHNFFSVETKPWQPQFTAGMRLTFQLRANPVITRQKKRYDVMMDAKYHAKAQGLDAHAIWLRQQQAALAWLVRQGETHGFAPDIPEEGEMYQGVLSCEQHRVARRLGEKPIMFTSVDYVGNLTVADPQRFLSTLSHGFGKSKALGCGLMLIKRVR